MKLHLPKMLTAALLAAFTAVGSSAFAENTTFTTTNSSSTNATNYSKVGFVLTLNGARLSTTSNPADVPIDWCDKVNLTSITFSNFRYQTGAGNSAGLVLADSDGKVLALSSNTVTTSGNVTWNFTNTTVDTDSPLYFYFYKANLTTIEVGDTLTSNLVYSDGGGTNGVAKYGSSSDFASCGFLADISTLANDVYGPKLSIVTSGVPVAQSEYTWKGTGSPAYWDTEATNWTVGEQPSQYTSGTKNVVNFNADDAAKDVTVRGAIAAGTVNVNDGYTFTVAEGDSLSVATMTVADGMTAGFAGDGTISVGTLNGTFSIASGATVVLNSMPDLTKFTMEEGAVLDVSASSADLNTIRSIAANVQSPGTVRINGSGERAFSGNGTTTLLTNLEFISSAEFNGHGYDSNGHTFNVGNGTAKGSLKVATDLRLESKMLLDVKKDSSLTVGGNLILGHNQANNPGFLNVDHGTFSVGHIKIQDATTANTVTLTDSTMKVTQSGDIFTGTGATSANTVVSATNVTLQNLSSGDIVWNHNASFGGTIEAGEGHTVTLGMNGASFNLTGTVAAASGSVTLVGTFAIDEITGGGVITDYVDASGATATSGFSRQSGSKTVYTGTVNADAAIFTLGGVEVEVTGGLCPFEPTVDYSTLWVNSGSLDYAGYKTKAEQEGHTLSLVQLANGAAINMNAAEPALNIKMTGASATVNASEATTIAGIEGWSDNTLTITGTGGVTLPSGTLTLSGAKKLDVQGTATTNKIELNSDAASLVVGADGDLTISGNNNLTVTKGTVDISGKLYVGHEIDLSNNHVSTGKITLHEGADVTVKDGMWMNYTSAGILLEEGAEFAITGKGVKFTGKANGGSIKAADGQEINYQASNDNALVSNVILEATGDINLANRLTNVDVVTGEHTVSLSNTIAVGTGTLGLNGTFAIGGISGTENATYAYADGTVAANGFKTSSTTRTVYTKEESGVVTVADGSIFKVGEEVVTLADNGTATTAAVTDNTKFYVNQGTETVSKAKEGAEMQNIVLAASTGLTVDDNFESAHISVASGTANVEISKDKVLTGTAQNMVLSGEGTYALNTNTVARGTNVTLGEGWAGIVRITDASANSLNFSTLVHGGSTLELKGFSGYPTNWYETAGNITENIKLTDGSNGYALKYTGSTQYPDHAAVFTGKLSGNGTLQTAGNKLGFTFTGDVEAWTGKIQVLSGTPILTFGGSATKVNAAIDRNGNTVALVVNNAATFSAAVNVSSTTLNGAATFAADSTLGAVTINNGGGLTVGENATVNVTSVTASGETTTMSGAGTLVLTQAVNLTAGELTMSGVYNIDAFEYEGERTIEGGVNAGNGFATEKGSLTVVTKAEGATLVAGEASVVRGGNKFSLANDGTVSLNSANYATFYITNLSETVTKAKSMEESSKVDLSSIHVSNGATLTVDQSIDLSLVTAETGAKLNILSGQTVSVGDATTTATIAGAGTYALKSGSKTMTGTLATGEDWTGTVVLSNISGDAGKDLNLNTYGHAGSKVEINGFTGYFLKAQEEFAPELVLGEGGLTLNNGYSDIGGATKPPTKYTFAGGVSGEGDMTFDHQNKQAATPPNVTQHLYFTGDVAGWSGSLNVVYGFTVYAQYSGENKTVNSTISRTDGTLHVEVGTGEDASVVTFAQGITASDLAVLAGATAYVNGGLTTSTITVADDATLAINGNTTLTSAITSAGTVTLTNVALSDAFQAQEGGEKQYFVESTANYYLGTAYEYLEVVTGTGAANATGTGLTWGGQEALTMAEGQVKVSDHGTASYDTLYIGQDTTTAEIALYDNIESLANIVVKNGKLTVGEGDLQQPVDISVIEHGTISGDVAPEEVEIGSGAIAEFTKPVETEAIRFSAAEEGTVKVTNNGDSAAAYSMLNTQQTVEAKTLELLVQDMVIVANDVDVDEIVNAQAGGVLSLTNAESVEIKSMTIGEGAIVQMTYKDEEQVVQEGTVTITESLVAGGGTLYANLNLENGSTLDLSGAGENALTLGSNLAFVDGAIVNLDATTLGKLNALVLGSPDNYLELVKAATGTTLTYGEDGQGNYNDMWFGQLFDRPESLIGDFKVVATEQSFGLTKVSNVPEPTTGTLSLLALMALAARRRKH